MTTLRSLPPPSVTLALGGLCTAYVFFSSAVEIQRGIIPLLNGRLGTYDLEGTPKAKLWDTWFAMAARSTVGTSVAASALNLTTSYIHPSPAIRRLALLSGIASILVLPTTLLVGLLGINSRLAELAKGAPSKGDGEADELVQSWEKKHLLRFPFYTLAFVMSYVGVVLDGRA